MATASTEYGPERKFAAPKLWDGFASMGPGRPDPGAGTAVLQRVAGRAAHGAGVRGRRVFGGLGLVGPAFVAAIAYVDPGNVASNFSAGAQFGYLLVWVVVAANITAGLLQYLSAKLGIVTGQSLPEVLGSRMAANRTGRLLYWAQAEAAAVATDLAEVVGGAIALSILFNLPLTLGAVVTGGVSTALLLASDRRGQRWFEFVVVGLLAVIAVGFMVGLVVDPPPASAAVRGLIPGFDGSESILLAVSMIGATVMPHALYLHGAAARDRHLRGSTGGAGARTARLLSATRLDVVLAMIVAGAVNLAMLLVSANVLRGTDATSVPAIHDGLSARLGPAVGLLFALGLLASGLASTAVGGYAGATIMGGLLHRRIPVLVRRVLTLIPALALLLGGVDPTSALLGSQVVLSFGIPFAVIPLVVLTAKREVMGSFVNARRTTAVGLILAAAIVGLNVVLLVGEAAALRGG
jgi:manganese transport protein